MKNIQGPSLWQEVLVITKSRFYHIFIKFFFQETQGFSLVIQDLILSFHNGRTVSFTISRKTSKFQAKFFVYSPKYI